MITRKIYVVISGFLLPHYYHNYHKMPHYPYIIATQHPKTTWNWLFKSSLDRFMMQFTPFNWRSDHCFLVSGKVIPTIRQTYPRLCPTLPKALGTCAQSNRLIVLMFSGIRAHVHGHKSSCTRAQVQYVTCYPLLYM